MTLDRIFRTLSTLAIFVAVLAITGYLSDVLLPFFIAWGIAYLIYPMVIFFQTRCRLRNRTLSIVVTLVVLIAIITGLIMLILPQMIQQSVRLEQLVAGYLRNVGQNRSVPSLFDGYVRPFIASYDWGEQIRNGRVITIIRQVAPGLGGILGRTFNLVSGFVSICASLLYLFFILLDYEQLVRGWQKLLPRHHRGSAQRMAGRVRRNMGSYFRGQSLVALCVGILFAIGFTIIDFPMAIALGLFIGVLNLVPYLQLIGIVPTVMLALLKAYDTDGSFWLILLSALAVFAVVQVIQDMVLTPHIMGKAMGLNPAMMLLSLSVWGSLLGFIGLIIGLPLTNLIIAYVNEWIEERDARGTEP